jgi:hypothetical protein
VAAIREAEVLIIRIKYLQNICHTTTNTQNPICILIVCEVADAKESPTYSHLSNDNKEVRDVNSRLPNNVFWQGKQRFLILKTLFPF